VTGTELQEGGVEAHEPDAPPALGEGQGQVAWECAGADPRRAVRGAVPPVAPGGEGVIDDPPIAAVRLVPELGGDARELVRVQQGVDGRIVLGGIGPEQVMVARHRDQHRGAGAETGQLLPERPQHLVLQPLELGRLAGLDQVAGEEHRIPGAAVRVQQGQVIEEGLAQRRPQPALPLEAEVKVGQVQPGEGVSGHGRGSGEFRWTVPSGR
jgi:hypothetical protein